MCSHNKSKYLLPLKKHVCFHHAYSKSNAYPNAWKTMTLLTLNVPSDCGSSRPTRVEPRLHCVGIEWQVRGRCVDSAAHPPLHAIAARALSAARAIEPRPTHFARVRALGAPALITQPTHFAWARALCVGPRTLRGPAHLASRPLCNPRA